jgi:hypothetical protein
MKKRVIFETSAINGLADDKDKTPILRSLGFAYYAWIPETVVSEVVADPELQRRSSRLTVFNMLRNDGNCISPFNWIIEQHSRSWRLDPGNYNWRAQDIVLRALEDELAHPELLNSLSEKTLESQRKAENQFAELFDSARPAFQKIFSAGAQRPPVREVVSKLLADDGAYMSIGAGFVERVTSKRPTEQETKSFVRHCPPFNALLVGLCVAQYDRCIRGDREPWIAWKAGRHDMFSAVYLPYCDVFVTRDEPQQEGLTEVASITGLNVSVETYKTFKRRLFGIAA